MQQNSKKYAVSLPCQEEMFSVNMFWKEQLNVNSSSN